MPSSSVPPDEQPEQDDNDDKENHENNIRSVHVDPQALVLSGKLSSAKTPTLVFTGLPAGPGTRCATQFLGLVKEGNADGFAQRVTPETLKKGGVATELLAWVTLLGSIGNVKASVVDYV
jgi:hypothetical protein